LLKNTLLADCLVTSKTNGKFCTANGVIDSGVTSRSELCLMLVSFHSSVWRVRSVSWRCLCCRENPAVGFKKACFEFFAGSAVFSRPSLPRHCFQDRQPRVGILPQARVQVPVHQQHIPAVVSLQALQIPTVNSFPIKRQQIAFNRRKCSGASLLGEGESTREMNARKLSCCRQLVDAYRAKDGNVGVGAVCATECQTINKRLVIPVTSA